MPVGGYQGRDGPVQTGVHEDVVFFLFMPADMGWEVHRQNCTCEEKSKGCFVTEWDLHDCCDEPLRFLLECGCVPPQQRFPLVFIRFLIVQ